MPLRSAVISCLCDASPQKEVYAPGKGLGPQSAGIISEIVTFISCKRSSSLLVLYLPCFLSCLVDTSLGQEWLSKGPYKFQIFSCSSASCAPLQVRWRFSHTSSSEITPWISVRSLIHTSLTSSSTLSKLVMFPIKKGVHLDS